MKSKSFKYQVKDVNEKGIVTIAISKFDNIDSYGDIVRKGAFAKTFKEGSNRIKHVLDHELKYQSVVGLPLKMYETDDHAIVESVLNMELQKAKDLFSNYKFFAANDRTLEHSFMYETLKRNDNSDIKGEEIAELKMYEYSTVAMGANSETPLLDIKSLKSSDDILKSIKELTDHLTKGDITNEQGIKIESLISTLKTYIEPQSDALELDYKQIFKNIL